MTQNNSYRKSQGLSVPIWEKYMLTVDEAVQYFGIGEKKIRMLIAENLDTEFRQQVAFSEECRKIKGFGSLRVDFYTRFKPKNKDLGL